MSDDLINLSTITDSDSKLVADQLNLILKSPHFKSASQMQRFLEYIVKKTLKGESQELKQYTIAVEALGFPADFDSDSNPAVRILGGRVRDRLTKYYQEEGKDDPFIFTIPKGTYTPLIKKNSQNIVQAESRKKESHGPKLGLFCFEDDTNNKDSNLLLVQITSSLANELSHYIFSRLYVQIPFMGEHRSDLIGNKAKAEYGVDFTLLLFVHELPENKYELIYRLWDNEREEVINSDIFKVYRGQPEDEQATILNEISAIVADFYQGKLHLYWARNLLKDESTIPEPYQAQVYYRYYADNLGKDAFEKASFYCLKAIDRNPQDVVANVIYADYCRRDYVYNYNVIDNPLETGKQCAATAIRVRPDSHEAHFALGQILFCLRDWGHSKLEFDLARRITKNHAVIEYGIGFHYCLMEHWQEGLMLVNKAMSLSSSYPSWFYLTPALNYYRQEKYQEALTEALKIVVPHLLHGPLMRCAIYGQLGKFEEAQKELQDLLRRCPDFLETGEQILERFFGGNELSSQVWQGVSKVIKNSTI